jgi:hypothetical protein
LGLLEFPIDQPTESLRVDSAAVQRVEEVIKELEDGAVSNGTPFTPRDACFDLD